MIPSKLEKFTAFLNLQKINELNLVIEWSAQDIDRRAIPRLTSVS